MTELGLKLALAKELPELIEEVWEAKGGYDYFRWLDTNREITDREWDWVVRKCEKKLTDYEWTIFTRLLGEVLTKREKNSILYKSWLELNWQQRATAYFKVKGTK